LQVDGDGVEAPLFQKPNLSFQFTLPEPLEMGDRYQVAALALQLTDRQPGALDVVEVFQAGPFDVEAEIEAGGQVKVDGTCRSEQPHLRHDRPEAFQERVLGVAQEQEARLFGEPPFPTNAVAILASNLVGDEAFGSENQGDADADDRLTVEHDGHVWRGNQLRDEVG